ncbi:MAG: ribonuclease D [Proteobacteria bacterium]|nr:ribonuclease D [Pseudomonadota bacterium]
MNRRIVQALFRLHAPVTTPSQLNDLAAQLGAAARVGLDTEFLRERTYRAQLCLVQLAGADTAACVDPLALADLEPLAGVLTEAGVIKVMHASRQDLEVLLPVAGLVRPVFDTQIAAALAGLPAQIGYAELVRRLLGHELPKSHTRTDWSRRPLHPEQIEYALDDVRYLLPLAAALEEQLARLGRLGWLTEELAALGSPELLAVDPQRAWLRLKGLQQLDQPRQRLAQQLAAWRERTAMADDRPRGWILDDTLLRAIVAQVPRSVEALAQIPDMPAGLVSRRGGELLACVEAADIPDPPAPLPGRTRPDATREALLRRLGGINQSVARELQIAPEVLATRRDLEQFVEQPGRNALVRGWRAAVVGEKLRAAL